MISHHKMQEDDNHLQLLSIFHYVLGGLVALISLFPIFHLLCGLLFLVLPLLGTEGDVKEAAPIMAIGGIFVLIPLAIITIGLSLAGCIITAGRRLGRRVQHNYCLVVAGIECLFMPLGTILGVFTIVVLSRNSVKELFGVPVTPPPTPLPPDHTASDTNMTAQSTPPDVPDEVTPDATAGIIPYKNPPALIAYYMGVFSVIPVVGFFLSIAAFILGIIGLKRKKKHPNAKGSVHAWIGIIAGAVLFIIHILALIAMISGIAASVDAS